MDINFAGIPINKILLKELEEIDSKNTNKIYNLASIRTMVPENSKMAKQIDMLIQNYAYKSKFGSFFTSSNKISSSRKYQKKIKKLEQKYDSLLEKDKIDEIYNASAPDDYGIEEMMHREDIKEILPASKLENFSVLALKFSESYVTGFNSGFSKYDKNSKSPLHEEETKRFISNFKRAIAGRKIKTYESELNASMKR